MTFRSNLAEAEDGGVLVVRRPRPTDAVGHSLREAFDAVPRLPADMHAAVERLNRTGFRHR